MRALSTASLIEEARSNQALACASMRWRSVGLDGTEAKDKVRAKKASPRKDSMASKSLLPWHSEAR